MLGQCTGQLQGYSVKISPPVTYEMWGYCNASSYLIKTQKLSNEISFDTGTSPEIIFQVSSGVSPGGTIILKGAYATKVLQIDTSGNITEQ
jgi:hypothetical protein